MSSHYKHMVAGPVKASGKLDVTPPFNGEQIASVDTLDTKPIEQALTTAADIFNNKSKWLSAAKRIEILERLADLMSEHSERLVLLSAKVKVVNHYSTPRLKWLER